MTRRGWVLLVMGLCGAGSGWPAAAEQYIEAYTDEKSYVVGDTICFHVSTDSPTFSIEIQRDAWTPQIVASVSGIEGTYLPYPEPEEQGWRGPDWPVSYTWVVPETWPTSSYYARLVTEDETARCHPLIIRHPVPGSQSRVAFVMNYNNRNAYNEWGGKSLYASNIAGDPHKAVHVSFQRPFEKMSGLGTCYWRQHTVYSTLEEYGFAPEYITEWDIYRNPNITRAYDVLVFTGHHEYISRRTYDALQGHHDRGGHLAFFSGNDIYWQIRLEADGHTLVCYKSYAFAEDPMYGVNDELVTTCWYGPFLNRPAEKLQGVRFVGPCLGFEPEDMLVQMSSHWMFEGTDLVDGEPLGELLAASETDYIWPKSPPIMDMVLYAKRDTPLPGMDPPVEYVEAAAVYYEDNATYGFPGGLGGQVFSSGSEHGWPLGLTSYMRDYRKVRLVTANIIQHMVDAPPAPLFADYDRDGEVNLDDFIGMENCFGTRIDQPYVETPEVWCVFVFDKDLDNDVDWDDFAEFMTVYTGPQEDCNANGVLDLEDILGETSTDCNANGVPDECRPGDIDGDHDVDLNDFATFVLCYTGYGGGAPSPDCDEGEFCCSDLDGDGDVDLVDFSTFAIHYGS